MDLEFSKRKFLVQIVRLIFRSKKCARYFNIRGVILRTPYEIHHFLHDKNEDNDSWDYLVHGPVNASNK